MIRFAHISDLHFSPLPQPTWRELSSKRIIGYINWQKNRRHSMDSRICDQLIDHIKAQNIDHLILSGDLVNIATPAEFRQVHDFLSKILPKDNLSVVPGNHDAYVPGALKQFIDIFQPWLVSNAQNQALPPSLIPLTQKPFPYVRIRENIAIIGLSSAIAMPPFIAAGYFDCTQAKALVPILQATQQCNLARVIVIHHPPAFQLTHCAKALWHAKRLIDILKIHGAELVLHGHTHVPSQSFISTLNGGKIPVVGISAACETQQHHHLSGYNLFEIDVKNTSISCNFQRYQLNAQNQFVQNYQENWQWQHHRLKASPA